MRPFKTLSSIRAAADAATRTLEHVDPELLTADAEAAIFEVKTAAQTATLAFAAVTLVALAALAIATIALARVPR
jgi:hypothetical protein